MYFYDENGNRMHYTIKHEDNHDTSWNDFFPIICQQGTERQTLRLKNDGDEHHIEDYQEKNEVLATMQYISDRFKLGKTIKQYKQLCLKISRNNSCYSTRYSTHLQSQRTELQRNRTGTLSLI